MEAFEEDLIKPLEDEEEGIHYLTNQLFDDAASQHMWWPTLKNSNNMVGRTHTLKE